MDTQGDKASASDTVIQQQREKKEKKEALKKQREENIAQTLSTASRFPILNMLVIVFYINAFLIFIFTLLIAGSDQTSNLNSDTKTFVLFGILMIGLFAIILNIAIAEVLRLSLSIESHLYDIREKNNR